MAGEVQGGVAVAAGWVGDQPGGPGRGLGAGRGLDHDHRPGGQGGAGQPAEQPGDQPDRGRVGRVEQDQVEGPVPLGPDVGLDPGSADLHRVVEVEGFQVGPDHRHRRRRLLDQHRRARPPRHRLDAQRPGPGEQVEHPRPLDPLPQHPEQRLPDPVTGRPRVGTRHDPQPAPPPIPPDNPHATTSTQDGKSAPHAEMLERPGSWRGLGGRTPPQMNQGSQKVVPTPGHRQPPVWSNGGVLSPGGPRPFPRRPTGWAAQPEGAERPLPARDPPVGGAGPRALVVAPTRTGRPPAARACSKGTPRCQVRSKASWRIWPSPAWRMSRDSAWLPGDSDPGTVRLSSTTYRSTSRYRVSTRSTTRTSNPSSPAKSATHSRCGSWSRESRSKMVRKRTPAASRSRIPRQSVGSQEVLTMVRTSSRTWQTSVAMTVRS